MSKGVWIGIGVFALLLMLSCGGAFFLWVMPQMTQSIDYSRSMQAYNERVRTLGEWNDFSETLDGGGNLQLTEIGVRKGESISVWKKGIGWKKLPDEKVNVGFEIKHGYLKGKVSGRDLDTYAVYAELGHSKMKPSGEFVIDVDNLRINDTNLFFQDGPFREGGTWKPGGKASGDWATHRDFRLSAVADVDGTAELWPFNKSMGEKMPTAATAQGLLLQANESMIDPVDRRVEFLKKSGEKVLAHGYTFYDYSGNVWWFFPYTGDLKEVEKVTYQVRDSHYIYLEDVDFF